jgi:hypothetical protein
MKIWFETYYCYPNGGVVFLLFFTSTFRCQELLGSHVTSTTLVA